MIRCCTKKQQLNKQKTPTEQTAAWIFQNLETRGSLACKLFRRDQTCLRVGEHVRLCAIDPDGDLGAGGAELLEEAAVCPDPQVLLRYLHLGARGNVKQAGKKLTHREAAARRGSGLRRTGSRSQAWCPGRAGAWQWRSCSL